MYELIMYRPLAAIVILLCVPAQTLAAILSCYRHPLNRRRCFENALEFFILAAALCLSLLSGEGPYLIISEAALLARAVFVCAKRARELKTGISALSIKAAVDALPAGVLFCEKNGFVLLCNERMRGLMTVLTGRVHRNGNDFYDLLQSGDVLPGCVKSELERQIVYLLPDNSAWMFTKTELQIKRRTYIQLTAADITERWRLTGQLRERESRLSQRREELSAAIANINTLSRERETQRAKLRTHDILGERLTLLLRAIRTEQAPDYELLHTLTGGLSGVIKAAGASARDELDSLVNTFGALGVAVEISGELPGDGETARLFAEIAREAVANAVKHGFATRVNIETSASRMAISDNGFSTSGAIKEGGGLGGMRKRLEPLNGALTVETQPRFTLTVLLPDNKL